MRRPRCGLAEENWRATCEVTCPASRRQRRQVIDGAGNAMPPAAAEEGIAQMVRERLNRDRVEPHQADVAERGSQTARVVELGRRPGRHRLADVEQQPHRDARLHLEHLQEQFLQPQVGAPVDGPQIVAVMEVAVVEELLAGSGKPGALVAAHQSAERLLPVQREPLQFLEEASCR